MMELIKTAALGVALSYGIVSAYNQPVQKLAAAVSSTPSASATSAWSESVALPGSSRLAVAPIRFAHP